MNYFLKVRIFVALLLISALNQVTAQHKIAFSNLTVENGLSQNSVMAIAQDSIGFMWFGTRQGINRYDGHFFKNYHINHANTSGKINEEVTSILTDFKGELWAGTSVGLMKYDIRNDRFETVKAFKKKQVEILYQDADHRLWIGTLTGLSLQVDPEKQKFKTFLFSKNLKDPANRINAIYEEKNGDILVGTGNGLISVSYRKGILKFKKNELHIETKSSEITAIAKDLYQNIWVGTTNGLYKLNHSKMVIGSFFHSENIANSLIHNDVRELMANEDGSIWIGTQNGLSKFNPVTNSFTNYQHNPEVNNSISHNSIHHIFKDRNKNIWVGTYFGGVNVIYPFSTLFKSYRYSKSASSISSNVISAIVNDKNNNLWIATEGGGLNYFNRKLNTFKSYKNNPADTNSLSSNLVKILLTDKTDNENLIIGTHRGIINILNSSTGKFQRISNVKDKKGNIGSAEIVALAQDENGKIWIGSQNGLSTLSRTNGKYPAFTTASNLNNLLKNKGVLNLLFDNNKNLWIGSTEGLYCYNLNSNKFSKFLGGKDRHNLQSAYINVVAKDAAGNLLIGTNSGFTIYNLKSNSYETFKETDGLINNDVLGIVEDENRNLWISTAKGLSEYNPHTRRFRNYTKSDGLAGNEFNIRSYFRDQNGEIFFGSLNGLSSFYPKDIQFNNYIPPIVFTGLKLFNKPIEVGSPNGILKNHLNLTSELDFTYEQNNFSIEFAVLNYVKPDKNQYAYKLEGYDKDWKLDANPTASYSNLPSGYYRFIVKGSNNDGVQSKIVRTLKIHVKPAPWFSWWAYLGYILLFLTIMFLTLRYFFVRALLKRTERDQQMKLSFFTHVSHEIRTPLTLILGPLESLLKQTAHLPDIHNQVVPIKNNADRLFRLVTELMDFRKTETGNQKLQLAQEDIVHFLQQIFTAFKDLAASRNINYKIKVPSHPLYIWMDKLQLEKVFFNLLSNSFKFTHDYGNIYLNITDHNDTVIIEVRDNGIGIPQNSRDQLFSDFFQVDISSSGHIGSGIGLALSKSIVVAHGGQIFIDSIPQTKNQSGDTSFKVILNKGNSPDIISEQSAVHIQNRRNNYQVPVRVNEPLAEKLPEPQFDDRVLIVEDNIEIRQLLTGILVPFYQIIITENGQKGWETAKEDLPDLIVCDIMMPVMNGLELCKKLKTDGRTSHIPVILLTAMDTITQQVDGLETGADSYVTKPFSIDLLLLNIRNLLQSRKIMRKKFTEEVHLKPQDITINKTDHVFMMKVVAFIEKKMANEDFVIPELAAEVGMSQPVLYKKIKALTDLSVNDFIKSIRLKKAAFLLSQGMHNVSEVAYLVGFNDPKYFSREFRKQFGETPKTYTKNSAKP